MKSTAEHDQAKPLPEELLTDNEKGKKEMEQSKAEKEQHRKGADQLVHKHSADVVVCRNESLTRQPITHLGKIKRGDISVAVELARIGLIETAAAAALVYKINADIGR